MHMFYRNVINILYIPIKEAYNQSCHGPLAQLAEHLTLNQGVQGSNPWWSTTKTRTTVRVFLVIVFRLVRDVVANHKTIRYAGAATKVIQKSHLA